MIQQMIEYVWYHQAATLLVMGFITFVLFCSLKYAKKVFGDEDFADRWVRSLILPIICVLADGLLVLLFICSLNV